MGLKGICSKCGSTYYGWALQEEKRQYCEKCATKLTITRTDMEGVPLKAEFAVSQE